MYLVRTPQLIQNLFPNFIWKMPTAEKILHLTFDDGPIPEQTPWVLDQLAAFDAKATFFCVGDNIRKNPEIFERIMEEGHQVGNHTFHHLNGWSSDNIPYYHDVRHCAKQVKTDLFRPPYGKLKPRQAQFLQRHYHIVMWDVLSGDFDPRLSKEQCLENVISNAQNGSIIVFHDSIKAGEKMQFALLETLQHFTDLGYRFESIAPKRAEKHVPLLQSA
ncbi:MAG: polysaccharide deacetylase family protein [Saprospiraceae bacterium]|nr:polysaccharide deacetylase family protein [Saprospiraceae bacterium]